MSRRSSSSRGRSGSRDSQRTDGSSASGRTSDIDPLANLNRRHAVLFESGTPGTVAGPSAQPRPTPSSFPRPTGLFHRPEVRMPQIQRPQAPVSGTSSGGGPTDAEGPPPELFVPAVVPNLPLTTPEGVPLPFGDDRPRFIPPQQAYVYIPFEGMTLQSARVCSKDKEDSSSATSAAAGKKIAYNYLFIYN